MEQNCKCSIITVCFNSEKSIENTIKSVLSQTYGNIEYIIVDGGSSDSTVNIIKKYEPLFEGRLRWVSEKDDGIYYAMNKGIDMSTGDLIGILNSDDTYEPDAVEKMCNAYKMGKPSVLYGIMRVFDGDRFLRERIVSHKELPQNMICHPACFVSRDVYEKYGKFNTKYVSAADYELMIRYSNIPEIEFCPVHEVISNFHIGGMSGSDAAFMDLLKLKTNLGMIKKSKYNWHRLIYFFMCIKRKMFK